MKLHEKLVVQMDNLNYLHLSHTNDADIVNCAIKVR